MELVRRLLRLRHLSRVAELLESYISQSEVLPKGSYQIRALESVPREVRKSLTRAVKEGQTWSCRAHGCHTWLFTCSMCTPPSHGRGGPALEVSVYGDDGALQDSGVWMPDEHGKWCRTDCPTAAVAAHSQ